MTAREILRRFIYDASAIVVGEGKDYLLDTRLMPVCRRNQLESLDALASALSEGSNKELAQQVIEAMTTNETSFFRHRGTLDAIGKSLVESTQPGQPLRIWSAASSTGQEPYSVAILMAELGLTARCKVSIVATDIDRVVLARARDAIYTDHELERGIDQATRARYFVPEDGGWKVKDDLRRLIRFEQLDITRGLPPIAGNQFELVLVRNVLIYFDDERRQLCLDTMAKTLTPGGLLVLGGTESTRYVPPGTERTEVGGHYFFRKPEVALRRASNS